MYTNKNRRINFSVHKILILSLYTKTALNLNEMKLLIKSEDQFYM